MPFTAPSATAGGHYVDNEGNRVAGAAYTKPDGTLAWASWDAGDGSPSVPVGPGAVATSQSDQDAALLAKLNRPAGSKIVSRSSAAGVDAKGNPTGVGNVAVTIAGPDGQPDQVILDASGNVAAGGEATKTPTKPAAGTTPRVDSPAQTATAAAATSNAATSAATQANTVTNDAAARTTGAATQANTAAHEARTDTETARHNAADEANARTLAGLQATRDAAAHSDAAARLAYDNKIAAIDAKYKDGTLNEAAMRLEVDKAHYERQDATNALDSANKAIQDENTRQYQQGSLANTAAQTAESTRANTATEADRSATLLQTGERDRQAALDRGATTGASLLTNRATMAQGVNDTMMQGAMGAKNYGLGSSADVSGLPAAAQGWATDMLGGQSAMDEASKVIHDANPALSGTPAGAGYASVLAQITDRQKSQAQPAQAPQQNDPATTGSEQAAGVAGTVSPSDPRYLGSVIGAAVQHLTGFTSATDPASRTTIPNFGAASVNDPSRGIQFTAPGATA